MGATKKGLLITVVVVVIVLVLVLIRISVKGVDYSHYAFKKIISTGDIDESRVYTEGLYAIGPNAEFLQFRADAHFVQLNGLAVATKKENELKMDVAFQYRLRKDRLNMLRERFNTEYEEVLASTAREAVKQTTIRFTNEQILRERKKLEGAIADALSAVLESPCCPPDCKVNTCKEGCIGPSKCKVDAQDQEGSQQNQFVELLSVQLTQIHLSQELKDEYLENMLLDIEEEKAMLKQNISQVESQTKIQVSKIDVERNEIKQNATTEIGRIQARANADAKAIKEAAELEGMELLYVSAGISHADDKNVLFYLRTLKQMKSAKLNINFDTLERR